MIFPGLLKHRALLTERCSLAIIISFRQDAEQDGPRPRLRQQNSVRPGDKGTLGQREDDLARGKARLLYFFGHIALNLMSSQSSFRKFAGPNGDYNAKEESSLCHAALDLFSVGTHSVTSGMMLSQMFDER